MLITTKAAPAWASTTSKRPRLPGTLRVYTSRHSSPISAKIVRLPIDTKSRTSKASVQTSRLSSVVVYDRTNSARLARTRQILPRNSSLAAAKDSSSQADPKVASLIAPIRQAWPPLQATSSRLGDNRLVISPEGCRSASSLINSSKCSRCAISRTHRCIPSTKHPLRAAKQRLALSK